MTFKLVIKIVYSYNISRIKSFVICFTYSLGGDWRLRSGDENFLSFVLWVSFSLLVSKAINLKPVKTSLKKTGKTNGKIFTRSLGFPHLLRLLNTLWYAKQVFVHFGLGIERPISTRHSLFRRAIWADRTRRWTNGVGLLKEKELILRIPIRFNLFFHKKIPYHDNNIKLELLINSCFIIKYL